MLRRLRRSGSSVAMRIRARPVHADHVGAHVPEQHAAEGPGADAGQFDDAQACERAHQSLGAGFLGSSPIERAMISRITSDEPA